VANVLQKNWQDLIKPSKLEIQPGRQRNMVATIVAEPLERGFGMTLGNALRRVLLSSLQGSAITSVHIDGVLHEFSSIPGVREDVTNIILNIKEIALRQHSDGVKRMVLKKEGPGVVKASDIEASSEVEILNPDHVICTLDQGASIRMEFTATMGKGYVPAERTESSSSSTFLSSAALKASSGCLAVSSIAFFGSSKLMNTASWSCSTRAASATASSGVMEPSVSTDMVSLS